MPYVSAVGVFVGPKGREMQARQPPVSSILSRNVGFVDLGSVSESGL